MRLRPFILGLALVCAVPAFAQQEREQTLADIRQELTVLFVEVQRLRRELSTTGAPGAVSAEGSGADAILLRLDAIEQEMRRLTAKTETLELRVERIVSDGTNRIGDLEFRLCELEAACDIASLGETPSLGGDDLSEVVATVSPPAETVPPVEEFAVGEQGDFDRALALYEEEKFEEAAARLAEFTQTYPGGPLTLDAFFYRGEALAALEQWQPAARAYLNAFTIAPEGSRAPMALLHLGEALGRLGQTEEACLTLSEVSLRFPAAPEVTDASAALASLGCT